MGTIYDRCGRPMTISYHARSRKDLGDGRRDGPVAGRHVHAIVAAGVTARRPGQPSVWPTCSRLDEELTLRESDMPALTAALDPAV